MSRDTRPPAGRGDPHDSTAGGHGGGIPRYLRDVLALAAGLPVGTVAVAHVAHEAGCPLLAGRGPCGCSPEATLREVVR